MLPDSVHNTDAVPTALPPVPSQPGVGARPLPVNTTPTPVTPLASESVVLQAQQLVAQYQQNPYQLNALLQQLKQSYIHSKYHIDINASHN